MLVPKIIIEGANLSGKSSIVKELEDKFVHSVAVTIHGYYHPNFLELVKDGKDGLEYHANRLKLFLPLFSSTLTEELLFNRFHLTASVYLKMFYGLEEHFYSLEEELDRHNVYLILVDFNSQALKRRLEERLLSGKEAPWGDNGFNKTKEKKDLYRYFFETSRIKNRVLVDNSDITAKEAFELIMEKTKNFAL